MKIAVSIPDDLFKRAERMTKRLGVSRSQLYQRALADFVNRQSDQAITDSLNAVYGSEPELGRLDPVIAKMQFASVPKEDW